MIGNCSVLELQNQVGQINKQLVLSDFIMRIFGPNDSFANETDRNEADLVSKFLTCKASLCWCVEKKESETSRVA